MTTIALLRGIAQADDIAAQALADRAAGLQSAADQWAQAVADVSASTAEHARLSAELVTANATIRTTADALAEMTARRDEWQAEARRLQAIIDAAGPVDPPPPPAPTYRLAVMAEVAEGADITCTLRTTGVAEGVAVGYSIAGLSPSDLSSGELGGAFIVRADGTAVQTFTLAADLVTEGQEVMLITLEHGLATASVVVHDTSTTPAPPPPPPVDPSGLVWEPAITGERQVPQYDLDDGGNGPNYKFWSAKLGLPWRNRNVGDWIDSEGTWQGLVPFAATPVPTAGYVSVDATALLKVLQSNGNQGIRLMAGGTAGALVCDGRAAANPPKLVVTTTDGQTIECPCINSAAWTSERSGVSTQVTTSRFKFDGQNSHAALRFNLSAVPADGVASAVLRLYVAERYGSGVSVRLFALQGQRFTIGIGDLSPVPGLAAEIGEHALAAHPDVWMAGDFTGTTMVKPNIYSSPKLFSNINANTPVEIIPDPRAPGSMMWRGSFQPVFTGTDPKRQAFDGTKILMFPDKTDPRRPAKDPVLEAWFRMYLELDADDWGTANDGNKMGITWDLRLGYWRDFGDYWQVLTGNGGKRGDGRKHREVIEGNERDTYHGHMLRMECGQASMAPFIYDKVLPITGYNYHIDQGGPFPGGDLDPLGGPVYSNLHNVRIVPGQRVCIEQHIRLNSIDLSVVDWLGNGEAIADGLLETEINGVLVDRRDNYRWRRHPEMGLGAVNTNWYLGGVQPVFKPMHFAINHLALARRRIGPRVAP